jgi:hypothetical protein
VSESSVERAIERVPEEERMRTKRLVVTAAVLAVLLAAPMPGRSEVSRFGESLSADLELTAIEDILEQPDEWAGKRVRIAGTVSGVCARQGCWIDLASDAGSILRVKVDDGVIVFPQDGVGQSAVAEGTVEILDLDRQRYEDWLRHVAEEEEREFDPTTIGDGPYRIVRLRGLGAEIGMP